jgi:hypothetical protein
MTSSSKLKLLSHDSRAARESTSPVILEMQKTTTKIQKTTSSDQIQFMGGRKPLTL